MIGHQTLTTRYPPGAKMMRLLADLGRTGPTRGVVRCACGLLGCIAMVGTASFSMSLPAEAAEPHPRRTMPAACRVALRTGDGHTWRKCREAWRAMYRDRRPTEVEFLPREQRPNRQEKPPKRAEKPARRSPRPPEPPPTTGPASPTAVPVPSPHIARESAEPQLTFQPLLLLGLLLPAAVAIGYPMRHRFYAMAGTPFAVPGGAPEENTAHVTYRPVIDPFAAPLLALTGPGATATARVFAVTALETCRDSALVIVPRPDAGALFGLAEDDLLDDTGAGLFIPGNLDAALAYMETELAARRGPGGPPPRRLFLVADCGTEAARISALLDRHPGGFTALLLGDWAGDRVSVDEEGLAEGPPALAGILPPRLPAMSRTEARDRLHATIQPSPRTPPSRRPRTRRR